MREYAPQPHQFFTPDTGVNVPHGMSYGSGNNEGHGTAFVPAVPPQQEERTIRLMAPENQFYRELLEGFLRYFENWQERFAAHPEFFIGYINSPYEHWSWDFHIVPTPDGGNYTVPERVARENMDIWDRSILSVDSAKHSGYPYPPEEMYGVGVYARKDDRADLADPYNRRPLKQIELLTLKYAHRKLKKYAVIATCEYLLPESSAHEYESVAYTVQGDVLEISKNEHLFGIVQREGAPLLSGNCDNHAKAFFDLVDSIIPQANPELPEPAGEQQP